jgi:hypothetical protein
VLAAQLAFTFLLLIVCSFAPGFFLIRRCRWSALEKLCGSIGLSLILVYLAAWFIYLFLPENFSPAYWAVSAICLVLALASWRDLGVLARSSRVRGALWGQLFLLAWTLLFVAIVRVYTGGGWFGDWLEHFQRSLFFLQHFPKDIEIFPGYKLPARPPMMNVLAAFFLGNAGDRFEVFQLAFVVLNSLVFLPCALLLPVLFRQRRHGILALAGIFAMNPVVMQNDTYTWTKSLAAFYVLLALSFYLTGWRKRDPIRMTAAFLALAGGLLVHYSAGPYVLFFALHYLLFVFRTRQHKWRELAAIAVICPAFLLVWVGWSISAYGLGATFGSNTAVTASKDFKGSNTDKVIGNIVDSIVPSIVRGPPELDDFSHSSIVATIHDKAFLNYQPNLILSMGLVGGPIIVWLLIRNLRKRRNQPRERFFWLALIAFSVFAGLAVVGERDRFGSAHLTLLPMELLGLTMLAGYFPSRRTVAYFIIAGCAFDSALGVLLHAHLQHLENSPSQQLYSGVSYDNGAIQFGAATEISLPSNMWNNWLRKHQFALGHQWLAEVAAFHQGTPGLEPMKAAARENIGGMLQQDTTIWRGWYSRHGGSVTLLGDHFGESNALQYLLVIAWLGLLAAMVREARAISPVAQAPPVSQATPARGKPSRRRGGH